MALRTCLRVATLLLLTPLLSGCAGTIVSDFTIGELTSVLGLASTASTGKGIDDHILSFLTQRDCNIMEGLFNPNRKICEPVGAEATKDDFKGFFVAYGGDDTDPLDRYARARQQELAAEKTNPGPVEVQLAEAISFSLPIRVGVPQRGEPVGRARVNGIIVYTMPPIYGVADLEPQHPAIVIVKPHRRPAKKSDPHVANSAPGT